MWLIFKKEFKELLRDKKTIIFMIGLPLLLFPAIFGVAFFFMSSAASGQFTQEMIMDWLNTPPANGVGRWRRGNGTK